MSYEFEQDFIAYCFVGMTGHSVAHSIDNEVVEEDYRDEQSDWIPAANLDRKPGLYIVTGKFCYDATDSNPHYATSSYENIKWEAVL